MKRKRSQSLGSDTSHQTAPVAESLSSQKFELRDRSPHTPDLPKSSLPLTEANLTLLENPATFGTMPVSLEGPAKTTAENIESERRTIEKHGILLNRFNIYSKYPQVKEAVNRILEVTSPSVMRAESAAKIISTFDEHAVSGEDTLFDDVWRLIFKSERQVKKGEDDWIDQEWKDDGLWTNRSALFKISTVSALPQDTEEEQKRYKSIPHQKDSKPDYCFGLAAKAFTAPEKRNIDSVERYALIQNQLYCAFCVVEFKGPETGIADAENQAARSGSTIVAASRQLQQSASHRDLKEKGADTDNIAFSICMTPETARIFVHWALVDPDGTLWYHMTRLDTYDIMKADRLKALRNDIYRIMDWGLLGRKQKIKKMLPYVTPQPAPSKSSKRSKPDSGTDAEESAQQSVRAPSSPGQVLSNLP
ncbi:MAG: hypothetical protein Q9181_005362 [Wetmoreana brouardii]